jgi:Na+/melibiose symporter-like transporter
MTGFVVGTGLVIAFLLWERSYSSPMLDLKFFKNPRFSAASGAIMLVFLALFGTIFVLTQYLQSVLGYSTIKAGAVLIPQSLALMTFAFLSPRWVAKFGNKAVVAVGLSLVAVSLLGFLTFQVDSSLMHVILVTLIMGVGMGNVMAPATESIMGSLPRAKAGVGSAMNDTTRQVGGAIGVAVMGSILSSHYGPNLASRLAGHVPTGLITSARDSVGRAVASVSDPQHPVAANVRQQVIAASHQSFIGGMHLAALVAAAIVGIAIAGVLIWLPARALPEPEVEAPATATPGREPVATGALSDLAVVLDHD